MKKLLTLGLVLILTLALFAGCGNSDNQEPATGDNAAASDNTDNTDNADQTADNNEEPDAVTTASIVSDADGVVNALSAEGTWIVATLNDVTVDSDITVDGQFHDKNDESKDIYRKLALYTQDADHNITEQFTLTAPKMVVKSENFRIQGGTFVGDVYVEANGFNLSTQATVEGNVYYATQEMMDSSSVDETSTITGEKAVKALEVAAETDGEADVVTTASIVSDADGVVNALSAEGTWIVATLNDVTVDSEIVVDGQFHNKNDESKDIYRKLALYTQDADHNITEQFTLTAPKMVVKSENFRIQGGTFVGDVYVEANGFNLSTQATVDGNVYYATQEMMDSSSVDETSTITGEKALAE